MITTTPGFSSRSTDTHIVQMPERDAMSEQEPGWSNGPHIEDEKDAQKAHEANSVALGSMQIEAGFSNSAPDSPAALGAAAELEAAQEPEEEPAVEKVDEPVKPAKKAAAKKTAKKAS